MQWSTRTGCCDEGNAALLSKIPFPSLHRHGCKTPLAFTDTGALCRFKHTASVEVSNGKVSSTLTQTTNFLWSFGFLNKSWEGEEFYGSGHALKDSFLNCHGLNNMPRPRCRYWYSVFQVCFLNTFLNDKFRKYSVFIWQIMFSHSEID